MKIYKIENRKTVKEIEVTNFTKKNRDYYFFVKDYFSVKDYFFKNCDVFWINFYHSNTNVFYSLKRH